MIRDGKFLLMKRAPNRKIAPGIWSCPGGHIEPEEFDDPQSACLRELQEETGITADRIFDLTLRYVIIRRWRDILRHNYIYFGRTDAEETIETREGTLHWVSRSELLDREFTQTFGAMLRHYIFTPEPDKVIVGVAENNAGRLRMSWCAAEDFEK